MTLNSDEGVSNRHQFDKIVRIIDSRPESAVDEIVQIWRNSPQFSILHYRLTDQNQSLLRPLFLFLAAKLKGLNLVLEFRTDVEPMLESGRLPILRRLCCVADCVLVSSATSQSYLETALIPSAIIDQPISLSIQSPRLIESVVPKIVSFGPLERYSNHAATIRAFKHVKQKYPRAELWIIGSGSLQDYLLALVDSLWLSSVTFENENSDNSLIAALNECDLLVDSSCRETLQQSTKMAMAAGLPVVKAQLNGAAEGIVDGENGLVFPINDHNALADRILMLVENGELAAKLSRNSAKSTIVAGPREQRMFWRKLYNSL